MRILMLIGLILPGCASYPLAPLHERTIEFVEQTDVDQKTAYQRVLVHFAKTFANSRAAIRFQDAESAHIIAKGTLRCKTLKKDAVLSGYDTADFTLEVQAKDKKVRITFADVIMTDDYGHALGWGQIHNRDDFAKLSSDCLEPFKNNILSAVSKTASF